MVVGVLFASLQPAGVRVPVILAGDDERNGGRKGSPRPRELARRKAAENISRRHFAYSYACARELKTLRNNAALLLEFLRGVGSQSSWN